MEKSVDDPFSLSAFQSFAKAEDASCGFGNFGCEQLQKWKSSWRHPTAIAKSSQNQRVPWICRVSVSWTTQCYHWSPCTRFAKHTHLSSVFQCKIRLPNFAWAKSRLHVVSVISVLTHCKVHHLAAVAYQCFVESMVFIDLDTLRVFKTALRSKSLGDICVVSWELFHYRTEPMVLDETIGQFCLTGTPLITNSKENFVSLKDSQKAEEKLRHIMEARTDLNPLYTWSSNSRIHAFLERLQSFGHSDLCSAHHAISFQYNFQIKQRTGQKKEQWDKKFSSSLTCLSRINKCNSCSRTCVRSLQTAANFTTD